MECQILRFTSYSANRKCVSYPLSDKIRTSFHLILSSKITCIFIKFFLLLWSENIRVYLKLRKKASTSKLICQFKTSRACTCSGYTNNLNLDAKPKGSMCYFSFLDTLCHIENMKPFYRPQKYFSDIEKKIYISFLILVIRCIFSTKEI